LLFKILRFICFNNSLGKFSDGSPKERFMTGLLSFKLFPFSKTFIA